jgi:hypothetical protein
MGNPRVVVLAFFLNVSPVPGISREGERTTEGILPAPLSMCLKVCIVGVFFVVEVFATDIGEPNSQSSENQCRTYRALNGYLKLHGVLRWHLYNSSQNTLSPTLVHESDMSVRGIWTEGRKCKGAL